MMTAAGVDCRNFRRDTLEAGSDVLDRGQCQAPAGTQEGYVATYATERDRVGLVTDYAAVESEAFGIVYGARWTITTDPGSCEVVAEALDARCQLSAGAR